MTRVLLVNTSATVYNLAVAKAATWWRAQGATVEVSRDVPSLALDYDVVWLSAVFSWDVPALIEGAQRCLDAGVAVEVGGPGTFGVRDLIHRETGLTARATPDARLERQPGPYAATFWSRGCPAKNCTLGYPKPGALPICSVPEMEGWKFTLYPDAPAAPKILDNNLSALPRHHQIRIIRRTRQAGFKRVDCNSGFEPRSFRLSTAKRWRLLPLVAWRFAYDEMAERDAVIKMRDTLDSIDVPRRKLHIYCLAGNEPPEACEQRVREIREWKAIPVVQARLPLDWTGGPLPTLDGWTEETLMNFKRWGNRVSKFVPRFADYVPGHKAKHRPGALLEALAPEEPQATTPPSPPPQEAP